MNEQQLEALRTQLGNQAAERINTEMKSLETKLNEKHDQVIAGKLSKEDFDKFKNSELSALNDRISEAEKLASVVKTQGDLINELKEKLETGNQGKTVSLEDFLKSISPKIRDLYKQGSGVIEYSSSELKEAGVRSFRRKDATNMAVGSSVEAMTTPPNSPYLPGIGGSELELFDIVRNPNFIINRVDVGRTNQSRLAWINETSYDGTVGVEVAEGASKPQISHKFKVEMSEAKKAAAYVVLTEEFEDDLPGLATAIRRMLQNDVLRAFDDAIQAAIIAVARPYEISGLDGKVPFTTLFDAMGALLAQIGFYNFIPNTLALNPVTSWQALMDKDSEGRYLNPPFMDRLNRLLVEATKVAVGYGLAGDLSQYKVDIYKDFTMRIGWINDQFIKNQFSIVGELRYHRYISDARKKAIVYNDLAAVQAKITAGS